MEKLKIGVVGAGNISCNAHLPAYANVHGAEIKAIADLDIDRARHAAEKFGIPKYFASVEEMLSSADIDAVDVCTWNNGHAPVAIAAADAGKHVICEKPLTVSNADALKIKAAVEKAGVRFMLAVPGRFEGYPNKVYQAIEKTMVPVLYYDTDPAAEQSSRIMVRKGTGSEDISGDYNDYPEKETVGMYGCDVLLRGRDGLVYSAVWNRDGYSFAINADKGLTREALAAAIEEMVTVVG